MIERRPRRPGQPSAQSRTAFWKPPHFARPGRHPDANGHLKVSSTLLPARNDPRSTLRCYGLFRADRLRRQEWRSGRDFEPSIRFCRILTFQASAFDHSATAPHALEGARLVAPRRRASTAVEREGLGSLRSPVSAAFGSGLGSLRPPSPPRFRAAPARTLDTVLRILTFQASAFDHSATAPHALEAASSNVPFRPGQARRKRPFAAPGRCPAG